MTRRVAGCGILIAAAMVLSYVEVLIPLNFGIPGVKLGLANLAVLLTLYLFDTKSALLVSVVRIILVAITFGSLAAMFYSMAGGLLSFLAMALLRRIQGFSVIGVSALGGVCHNIGQIAVAAAVVENLNMFFYLPVLMISGIITGVLIGIVCQNVIPPIKKNKIFN